jgi:hypothetical protein
MDRLLTALLVCAVCSHSAWSQSPIPQPALTGLRQYLSLTDDQVKAISQNNNDYATFTYDQQQQIQQAQSQIAVETAKPQLDPIALGTLYAAIETTCRGLRDKAAAVQQQNISILTDAQKAKLNMLSDAVKLAPTVLEAQAENLLASAGLPQLSFSPGFSIAGFIGLPSGSLSGCTSIRSGNFVGIVPPPAPGTQPHPEPTDARK